MDARVSAAILRTRNDGAAKMKLGQHVIHNSSCIDGKIVMKTSYSRLKAVIFGCSLVSLSSSAHADLYAGPQEVTNEGPEVMKEAPPAITDATELALQAGGIIAGGNAQSAALTASTRFLLRRGAHETGAILAANYARSGREDGPGMTTTMENYQGRIRYDYFWTEKFSTFLAVQARRDRFQALNLRLGIDPGLSYFFVRNDALRLWAEAGYDFQYDVLTQETLDLAEAEGASRDRTETDHNARFYLGYDQSLDDRLKLHTGFEFFKSFVNEASYRINWNAALQTQLVKSFSLAIGSTAMYNNTPLPGIKKFDVTTSVNFVYTFL